METTIMGYIGVVFINARRKTVRSHSGLGCWVLLNVNVCIGARQVRDILQPVFTHSQNVNTERMGCPLPSLLESFSKPSEAKAPDHGYVRILASLGCC